jgi:hypothetical protein
MIKIYNREIYHKHLHQKNSERNQNLSNDYEYCFTNNTDNFRGKFLTLHLINRM